MKNQFNKCLNLIVAISISLSLVFPPLLSKAAYHQADAINYLSAHTANSWSVMAQASVGTNGLSTDFLKNIDGTSAIDYEAPILAITAMGHDPRTFGQIDYIAKLKTYHTAQQIGDPSTTNDDIFGILALISAGVPQTDQAISDAKQFVISNQNPDNGWGFMAGGGSDSNMTAAAILSLVAAGVPQSDSSIQTALDYLESLQKSDGGFAYDSYSPSSDSPSTAWAVWALNKLGIDPATWDKSGNNPLSYLQGNQAQAGYIKYQESSGEDSRSPVTTAYAVIALSGNSLPVNTIAPAPSAPTETFPFRIEGSSQTICEGNAAGPTALDIVKNAAMICGFDYHIKPTDFGPYLERVGSDTAQGIQGWMYLVNYASPSAGATDYVLRDNDEVLWYFGDYYWQPVRLTATSGQTGSLEFPSGQSFTLQAEYYANGSFEPLVNANVYYGVQTVLTNNSGQATLSPQDGYYKIYAQKEGYVKSNSITAKIGQPQTGSVNLSAEVINGLVQGEATNTPDIIAFTVNPSSLDFGTLASGSSTAKTLAFSNTGTVDIKISAQTGGDSLFTDYLKLNSFQWRSFSLDLNKGSNQDISASLAIPGGTVLSSGRKTGQVVFWANPK